MLAVLGIVVAVGVSVLRGGRVTEDSDTLLRWLPALLLGLLLQTALDALAVDGLSRASTVALLLLSEAAVLAFCIVNWFRPGMGWIALGFSLNALVILANGGMPVSAEAIRAVGGDPTSREVLGKHVLADADTALRWLGDVIPIAPAKLIVSIGDIVLVGGMIPLAHDMMTPPTTWSRLARRPIGRLGPPTPTRRATASRQAAGSVGAGRSGRRATAAPGTESSTESGTRPGEGGGEPDRGTSSGAWSSSAGQAARARPGSRSRSSRENIATVRDRS